MNSGQILMTEEKILNWIEVETAHASIHPNSEVCGGVGGCALMRAGSEAEDEMLEAILDLARTGENFTLNVVRR